MPATLSLDDHRTIEAIGILADVLDRFSGSTALECTLVSKALRQVQETRSAVGMDFASRAFATLDRTVRERIAGEAADAAQVYAISGQRQAASKPGPRKAAGSGLLDAVNNRIPGGWASTG